jgi:hypothetical protein
MFECIALGKPVQEESLKAFVHECAGRVTHLYEGITVSQIRHCMTRAKSITYPSDI